jgi:hypothetical protein
MNQITSINHDNQTLLDNDIPAKFKDPETGEILAEKVLKSYKELEKKISKTPSVPKSSEDYSIDCEHGLFEIDTEMNRILHQKGFTNEQVQTVYDLAAEKMVPMVMEIAGDFQADREVEKLIEYFGGVEKWKEISRQLLAFGQKNLPADVLDSLSSSFEGVLALHNMMSGKEPSMSQRGERAIPAELNDLNSMMRDPKYWRDKDPSFVAKVTEGFQKIYGNN